MEGDEGVIYGCQLCAMSPFEALPAFVEHMRFTHGLRIQMYEYRALLEIPHYPPRRYALVKQTHVPGHFVRRPGAPYILLRDAEEAAAALGEKWKVVVVRAGVIVPDDRAISGPA